MEFFIVAQKIGFLFLLMAAGFVLGRTPILAGGMVRKLSWYLVNLALPALIVVSLQIPKSDELVAAGSLIVAVSLAIYALSAGVAVAVPRLLGCMDGEAGVFRFIVIFSNVGFMGYPVVEAVFGADGLFYASLYNLPFHLLVFTLGIFLLQEGAGGRSADIRAVANPGVLAVCIGVLLFAFGIALPPAAVTVLDAAGSTTTPLAMLVVGALLSRMRPDLIFGNRRLYALSAVRLLVLPLMTWLLLAPFIADPMLLGIPVIISAMPAAANTAILAEEFGGNADLASQGVFLSTLFCIATIPGVALFVA
ncbi:MAG: AEC family transporter [Methanomicrobiales archaeon]|nr:AEC family transporter [Methanomicrobiales archaeon]